MKKFYYLAISLGLFVMIFLSGCGGTSYQTIRYENDGNGFLRFYTNDPKNYGDYFTCTYSSPASPTNIEAVVKQMSGSKYLEYGIVYGFQDINNFYEVVIDTIGHFAVYKMKNGVWIDIIDWTTYLDLKIGYNQPNTIHWVKKSSTNFEVNFNNSTIYSYYDDTFVDGRYGFITIVDTESMEYIYTKPIDTRFQFSTPVTSIASFNSAQMNVFSTKSIDGPGK